MFLIAQGKVLLGIVEGERLRVEIIGERARGRALTGDRDDSPGLRSGREAA